MKRSALIFLVLIICQAAFAQHNKRLKDLGDKAFADKNYVTAADYYKQAIDGPTSRGSIPFYSRSKKEKNKKTAGLPYLYFQLAESYRLFEDYINAGEWYYKIIDENDIADYPLSRLWYGVCLRAGGDYIGAAKQFRQFITDYKGDAKYTDIAHKELADCRFAVEQQQYPSLVTINRLKKDWNIEGGNFAMIKHGGTFYFTSSSLSTPDKRGINEIYALQANGNTAPVAIKFNSDKKDISYSTPSVDGTGKRMYITCSYKENGNTVYAIYLSTFNNNLWTVQVKLNANVNAEGSNSIQPSVTPDGTRLFYSSNKPGGQGGYDIWESDLDADGSPTNATNLGSTINTPDDEQAPYYDAADNFLIYSSKGFTGFGGFDFFKSFYNSGQWSAPQNMGYPMNSSKDDLYYFPDDSVAGKYYTSSDRESECCLSLFEGFENAITIKGNVINCYSQQPLQGVKIALVDSLSGQQVQELISGNDGSYSFKVSSKRPYTIALTKTGYFTKIIATASYDKLNKDTLFNSNTCLQQFEVNKPIVIKNILYDFNKATLRPESEVVLDEIFAILKHNPAIKIELSSHTDSIGSDAYNMTLSQARAQSCVDYLIAKGIDASRVTAHGYGKTRPLVPNSNPDGTDNPGNRQLNRRTEFTVLKTE